MDDVENILIGFALLLWIAGMVGFAAWWDHRYEVRRKGKP